MNKYVRVFHLFLVATAISVSMLGAMDPPTPTYYTILGIKEDADTATIEAAYKALINTHHPLRQPKEYRAQAIARFKEICEAFNALKDPVKRKAYDETLHVPQDVASLKEPTSLTAACEGVPVPSHPSLKENALQSEKVISEAYKVLKDPVKRKAYDEALHAPQGVVSSKEPTSLTAAYEGAPVVSHRSLEKEALQSEIELIECLKQAITGCTLEQWTTFLTQCDAHLHQYSSVVPCQHLTLIKKCSALLQSQLVKKSNPKPQVMRNFLATKAIIQGARLREALTKEIQQLLEALFYEHMVAIDTGEKQKAHELQRLLDLVKPAVDLAVPGLFAHKKTFFGFIRKIDMIDHLDPAEAIGCVKDFFDYTAKRGLDRKEWLFFLALCDVAVEKWGRQGALVYLQTLAQIVYYNSTTKELQKLLNDDLKVIERYLKAKRHEDAMKKLRLLQSVQKNYLLMFKRQTPIFEKLNLLAAQYLGEDPTRDSL